MDNVTFPYPITSARDLMVMNPCPLASLMPARAGRGVVESEPQLLFPGGEIAQQ